MRTKQSRTGKEMESSDDRSQQNLKKKVRKGRAMKGKELVQRL